MGNKSRETSTDEETNVPTAPGASVLVCQKRHKRHKHKKHKRKKTSHDDEEVDPTGTIVANEADRKQSPKVRGGSGKPSAYFGTPSGSGGGLVVAAASQAGKVSAKKKNPNKSGKGKESATSSEEERWLDAIESGKLEEVDDELKKIKPKDPKLMTARQRAMFERKTDTEPNPGVERLVSLPTGYKEKVMTAEAIQKAALKSLKRKQLADEKREKDKKKTMERLLKKQESKASKLVGKGKAWKRQVPLITYRTSVEAGSCISLPDGHEFPLSGAICRKSTISSTSEASYCSIAGCKNRRRYCCSKTGVPLCSLECYRANLAGILT